LHSGAALSLSPGAARHVQVLRLQPGDSLTLFGGAQGGEFEARILRMGRSEVWVEVGAHHALEREATRPVHLAVGMPANERMDWLVEKAVELGVASLQPLMGARSVLRMQGERSEKKQARWQAIAIAACEQCGRNRVPAIAPVADVQQWLQQGVTTPQRRLLSLRPGSQPFGHGLDSAEALTLLSGPEGGFTDEEEHAALSHGFQPVRLGRQTLRAETAALAALAATVLQAASPG